MAPMYLYLVHSSMKSDRVPEYSLDYGYIVAFAATNLISRIYDDGFTAPHSSQQLNEK